ncbi:hypothetical protein SOVF_013120 [Spinacia oleracea]|nr:hypothetical protein SOVF_013120 [Spinacia oleracea]
MGRRIGIVGAGISGLLACKYALTKGYHPIVFESRNTVGGVWTQTLKTTKLQTCKPFYQFSDYHWPSSVQTLFPDSQQVFDYFQSYANHFNLLKHIRFNTKVVSIKYEGPSDQDIQSWALWGGNGDPFGDKGKWIITTLDLLSQSIEVMEVDFVILCLGRYSDVADMPEFPSGKGPDVFEGMVMHSMEYSALDYENARNLVNGKQVTVVGFQKSALDITIECSNTNGVEHPCTIICRTPHWNATEFFPWKRLYSNRFSQLMLHKPGEGLVLNLLASVLSPLDFYSQFKQRWGMSKFVENDIKKKQPIEKYDMVPDHSFLQEMSSCSVATVPAGFYENVEKGSIVLKRSKTFTFYKEGVLLDNNSTTHDHMEAIKCDLVIFATGFKGDQKLKDIFASPGFQDCIFGSPSNTLPLYRECVHPRIPQVAVIGFSESAANLFTSEIRCRWLFELLDGKFKLPNIQEMEKDVLEWNKFMKRYSGKYFRRSCMGALHIWYYDQLCKDMGLNPNRKKGFWAELFEPYGPSDYA